MPRDNEAVIDEITREIKAFGDDMKSLRDSMQTDLAAVRKLAEEAKGSAERPEVKAQIDALTKSVDEKHAALEGGVQKRIDALETRLNRPGPGPNDDKVYERAGETPGGLHKTYWPWGADA